MPKRFLIISISIRIRGKPGGVAQKEDEEDEALVGTSDGADEHEEGENPGKIAEEGSSNVDNPGKTAEAGISDDVDNTGKIAGGVAEELPKRFQKHEAGSSKIAEAGSSDVDNPGKKAEEVVEELP